jgi:hypothetical protein
VEKAQDNGRQEQQIEHFELEKIPGRQGADAKFSHNGRDIVIELKTRQFGHGCTTARDIDMSWVENKEKSEMIWIISSYSDPRNISSEHYVLFPEDMKPKFEDLKRQLNEGSPRRCGIDDWNAVKRLIPPGSPGLEKVNRSMMTKGVALNNPKIPDHYISKHGHRVESLKDIRKIIDKQKNI